MRLTVCWVYTAGGSAPPLDTLTFLVLSLVCGGLLTGVNAPSVGCGYRSSKTGGGLSLPSVSVLPHVSFLFTSLDGSGGKRARTPAR